MKTVWTHFAGDLLRHSRAQVGLTQHQLAILAGVSDSEVARIETYRVQPSIPVLGRLLDILGVTLSGEYNDSRIDARSISNSIRERLLDSDEEGAYRTWLILVDDLDAVTPIRLLELVRDPAIPTGQPHYDALVAALVEYACRNKSVEPPVWVFEPWRVTEGYYVSGIPALHDLERAESPEPFARRGIFISRADLSHV